MADSRPEAPRAEAPPADSAPERPSRARGTLRLRITALAVTVVVVVLLITSIALITAQHELLQSAVDAALVERADELDLEVRASGRWPPCSTCRPTKTSRGRSSIGRHGRRREHGPGRTQPALTARREALPSAGPIVTRSEPALDDEAFPYRLLVRDLDASPGLILVASDLEDVLASTRTLTVLLAIAIPIVASVLAILVWVLVGRTLRPVEDIRATVAGIGARSLDQRVPRPPGDDEIARLADTMNAMLDRIEDATRRQQRFVADASHELRTPLTRLRARLEQELNATRRHDAVARSIARGAGTEPDDPDASLRDALDDTIELQHLADDLLAVARGDALSDAEPRVLVDLDDIVLREVRRLRENGRVDVDASAVSAASVIGEPAGLTRVVRNLLENAERHAGSRVTLSLHESDHVALLAVADDGPGVRLEERELVFERFARMDDARTRDAGGTGLGLAIVRDIVARHDGSVIVDPDHAPGARFLVTLPLAAA